MEKSVGLSSCFIYVSVVQGIIIILCREMRIRVHLKKKEKKKPENVFF